MVNPQVEQSIEELQSSLVWSSGILRDDVEELMQKYEYLRYHRNRPALVRLVKLKNPKASYESITRCQRLVWADGLCLPNDPKELAIWRRHRKK